MPQKEIQTIVTPLCQRLADKMNYELVDAELVKEGPGRYLRIYIDRPGGISLDDGRRLVCAEGRQCALTYTEYELLKALVSNCGMVLSREKLMVLVWGTDFAGESRTVDVHVKTLRQKLGSCGDLIKTVRNVGYKIEMQ